ncbi:MAG: protein kinase [Planctomycetes bacterium]|nr:protein kinase [Planctomycetota bacterium]
MNKQTICKKCGKEFFSDSGEAKDAVCPKCLAEFAMASSNAGMDSQDKAGLLANEPVLPENSVIGAYKITGMIGRGGMGTVYKAYHQSLDRYVAVKILPSVLSQDTEFLKRFNREAKALARLSHPNIVTIYDMGQADGHFYFVMEFVEGVVLRDLIADKKLQSLEALALVPQLCDALEYAHSEGVVHRDIKPENIIIDKKGRVKIADFGLARIVKGDVRIDPVTRTQEVMGTFEYMAPEQRTKAKDVDHRADIYSLGVVFYEMLTGELPIGKFELPSRKVQIDVRLDDVVLRTLEKDPEKRYQHASHVGEAVSSIISENAPQSAEYADYAAPAREPKYSALSIAGLVCSFVPLIVTQLIGFILGIMAFRRINRSNGALKGTGLAIASIVVSAGLGFFLLFITIPIIVPAMLAPIAIPELIDAQRNEQQIQETLQKLATAQTVYYRARELFWQKDSEGRYIEQNYPDSVKSLVETKGLKEAMFNSKVSGTSYSGVEGELIASADQGSLGDKAKPFTGYYFRSIRGDNEFAIAAYPERSGNKTFIVDNTGMIYSTNLGNLKYPDAWKPGETYKDAWQAEKRLDMNPAMIDEIINKTSAQLKENALTNEPPENKKTRKLLGELKVSMDFEAATLEQILYFIQEFLSVQDPATQRKQNQVILLVEPDVQQEGMVRFKVSDVCLRDCLNVIAEVFDLTYTIKHGVVFFARQDTISIIKEQEMDPAHEKEMNKATENLLNTSKISVSFDETIPLNEAIEFIRLNSKLNIVFDSGNYDGEIIQIPGDAQIPGFHMNTSVKTALEFILEFTGMRYTIKSGIILINEK